MIKTQKITTQIERKIHPIAKKLLKKPDNLRIQYINSKNFFIHYDAGKQVFKEILELLEQPIRPRMEGMLLTSDTNNGKTTLIERFISDHIHKIGNLVRVEVPERATLKEFYADILNKFGYPISSTRSTGDLRRKIVEALDRKKIKILFVDEIHNLLDSRRDHQKDVLNGLKSLNNKAKIPIVLIGTDRAKEILAEDDQVADRYLKIELPLWIYEEEKPTKNKPLKDLLATFEAYLPLLKASELFSDNIVSYIHKKSQGRIGRIAWIIRRAAKEAIQIKKEQITLELLKSIRIPWD